MNKFKGAIFDLDGVIVNTVPLHFKAWKRMFSEYGITFSKEDYEKKVDGKPRVEGARAILTNITDEELIRACDKKNNYFNEFLEKEDIEVFETSITLVKQLKQKGIKMAVASSSKNADNILKKIELYDIFDADVSGTDFKKGKPDPEIFLTAAKRLGLSPMECMVFEDAQAGVEAAKNGGFLCVGINRYESPEKVKKADLVVKDLKEIGVSDLEDLFRRKNVY